MVVMLGLQSHDKAAMLVVNTINNVLKIYMNMVFSSQWRQTILFVITNMAAVTLRANQQCNRSLQSSKNPHFQNEAKCTTFLVKVSFICMRMINHFQIKG